MVCSDFVSAALTNIKFRLLALPCPTLPSVLQDDVSGEEKCSEGNLQWVFCVLLVGEIRERLLICHKEISGTGRTEDLLTNNTNNWLRSLQVARRDLVSVLWSWQLDPCSSSSSPSRSPWCSWWRWSRSTREPSSSDWADCWQEEPGGPGSSSSSPVWISTRRLIWGVKPLKYHRKR